MANRKHTNRCECGAEFSVTEDPTRTEAENVIAVSQAGIAAKEHRKTCGKTITYEVTTEE
jgi:hypothetical protein